MLTLGMDHCPGQLTQEKLWKSSKLKLFENPFNKDKSVGVKEIPCTKKDLKFALIMELAQLKFTYITVVKILALGHY